MLTGKITPETVFKGDDIRKNHKRFPMFAKENIDKINKYMKKYLKPIADKYNISLAQLSSVYVTSQKDLVALVGARNETQAVMNAKAGDVLLSPEKINGIKEAFNKHIY